MKFATGYVPDPAGHKRTSFGHLRNTLKAQTTPDAVSLPTPAVMFQASGSCTGHAYSCFLYAVFFAAFAPNFVPSPAEIYRNGRAIDRLDWIPIDQQPLTDDGAMPNQVKRAVNEYGVEPMKATVGGRYSDDDPATVNDEPKLLDLEVESENLMVGDYGIISHGKQRVAELRMALANGLAVTAAIAGGSNAFQSYTGGVLGPIGEPLDHYVCIVGYRTVDGRTEFRIRNSWGEDWGERGDCWINEEAADELGDLITGAVQRKEAA